MIYHTMTRNRVLRLTGAKGWLLTGQLFNDLYYGDFDYFEVTFIREYSLLRGNGYDPDKEQADDGTHKVNT